MVYNSLVFNKVLITGFKKAELSPQTLQRLSKLSKKIVFCSPEDPKVKSEQQDTDCLLVKFNPVAKEDINHLPKLKYVGVLGTGYGKVDTNYAKTKKVTVTNVPGYSTESVAEFVFAAILENIRELEKAKKQARNGNYSEDGFKATELKNKKFGVVGLGRIGTRVSELAMAFGANVSYWSKNRKKTQENKGTKYQDLQTLLNTSDVISIHLALNSRTEKIISGKLITSIKKGAVVVNTAPMELLDLKSLEMRLQAKDLVFILDHSDEMNSQDAKRISKYQTCIVYPPIGYISEEAREGKQQILIDNIENFLKGTLQNVVNP